MKYTPASKRVFEASGVITTAAERCVLWEGLNVKTSLVRSPKGTDLGLHKHETWVQVYVIEGLLYCSNGPVYAGPGDFFFVEPGEIHHEVALEDTLVLSVLAMPNIVYPVSNTETSDRPVDAPVS